MTTEEIEKDVIQESAEEYIINCGDIYFTKTTIKNAFIAGAAYANSNWQEKTRWIPIEEKIPPSQSRTRQILAKNKHTVSVVFISCTEEGYLNSIKSLKREFTDWKEIE